MVKQIKQRVKTLLTPEVKIQLIRICVIVSVISLISTLLKNVNTTYTSFLAGVASILLIPISHGEIVAALKVVRNSSESLSDQDALVGITRFKELFTTYFLKLVFEYILIFVVAVIGIFAFVGLNMTMITQLTSLLSSINSGDTAALSSTITTFAYANATLLVGLSIVLLIVAILAIIFELYLFAVPYLLEQYKLKNTLAIKTSFRLMKGHCFELFKLELSFLPRIIACGIIIAFVNMALNNVMGDHVVATLASSLLSVVLAAYIYYPQLLLAKTIFFEEISYNRL